MVRINRLILAIFLFDFYVTSNYQDVYNIIKIILILDLLNLLKNIIIYTFIL